MRVAWSVCWWAGRLTGRHIGPLTYGLAGGPRGRYVSMLVDEQAGRTGEFAGGRLGLSVGG